MGFSKEGLEEFCEHMWLKDDVVVVAGADGVEVKMTSDGETAVLEDENGNKVRLDPQVWGHLLAAPEALMERKRTGVGIWQRLWGVEG